MTANDQSFTQENLAESGITVRAVAIQSKADLDDQRWLDQQVATLGDGIEAARDIWLNWTENRNVSRFAGGLSYGDFIASRLGYPLPLDAVLQIMPGASTREIAKVAGVNQSTVVRNRGDADASPDEPPARVIGADGKSYPGRVVREVHAEVIEAEEDENAIDMTPDPDSLNRWYVYKLSKYIKGVVMIMPPALGQAPTLLRRRYALERALQATLVTWAESEQTGSLRQQGT
jgi:hypothetical protein